LSTHCYSLTIRRGKSEGKGEMEEIEGKRERDPSPVSFFPMDRKREDADQRERDIENERAL
jgi:hypothetical protein